jgi:hypothetical protein
MTRTVTPARPALAPVPPPPAGPPVTLAAPGAVAGPLARRRP